MERHGYTCRPTSKIYRIWESMKQRCLNPRNVAYKYYGARGISVCDEWRISFLDFLKDIGNPSEGETLDRIDNDKGYYKENCRWTTQKEQMRNTRRNRYITFNGKTKTIGDWAQELGLKENGINSRLNLGWTMAMALSTPTMGRGGLRPRRKRESNG